MSSAKIALLEDRGVIAVTGDDAHKFLQGLITNDLSAAERGEAVFAALLSPQGKILFDFLIAKSAEGYVIDVARDQADALVKRLTLYRLRSKVSIENESEGCCVMAAWGQFSADGADGFRRYVNDPRSSELGRRTVMRRSEAPTAASDRAMTKSEVEPSIDYHAHRISRGVPEGGKDFAWGEIFPHEANMDVLHGVSFHKGCYVGQEIVSRMQHRGTARRRVIRVRGSAPLPAAGTEVKAGGVTIGVMGTSAGGLGLALLRLDRVSEFQDQGVSLAAGSTILTPDAGDLARLAPPAKPVSI